ncbi:methylated-DNA--[protein]-cysteine S-methyltransferase [Odoribacter sp. OttesenSCG-928-L07]|nr:methylated-DNA--[protein]-cysteine S-methyltransferase [Odoribacter sp. OttesenSCG-928-L07]MDL2238716.1 methylated-DNA--[protein]-cysteine S-methyltransferase [Bacteroidales bacterium OttesenSCG-928-L14]
MNQTIKIQYYKSPYGELIIGSFNEQLCLCDWKYRKSRSTIDSRIQKSLKSEYVEENSDVIQIAISQLEEYFNKQRTQFDIPFLMIGTEFQKSVWDELLKVPYGKTASYMDLSKRLNNVNAIRAVASANGANAISIIIPCHRIIGSNRELVGYAGGLQAKRKLLELESHLYSPELNFNIE